MSREEFLDGVRVENIERRGFKIDPLRQTHSGL